MPAVSVRRPLDLRRDGFSPGHGSGQADVVVIEGDDGMRAGAGRVSAQVARTAFRGAGDHVEVVRVDARLAEELDVRRPDFVFPCVFGDRVDDGMLQDMLELLGIPYVGSRAQCVRTCADKLVTKRALAQTGLSTLPGRFVSRRGAGEMGAAPAMSRIVSDLGSPLVVKPVRGNAGLGVKLIMSAEHLARALSGSLLYESQVIVEPYVPGRELSVVVVGPEPHVLGVVAVNSPLGQHPTTPLARTFRPAGDDVARTDVVALAKEAFAALGCRDVAIVDFLVDDHGEPWVLEVDTAVELAADGKLAAAARDARLSLDDAILVICARCRGRHGSSASGA